MPNQSSESVMALTATGSDARERSHDARLKCWRSSAMSSELPLPENLDGPLALKDPILQDLKI
jgi:hypothetical protein